jgi:flagellar motor switch protein FliN/FliY
MESEAPTTSEQLERLAEGPPADPPRRRRALPPDLEALRHLELAATVELGRTTLTLEDLSDLRVGGLIALDRPAGQPVDLYINGSLFARGEVVAINEYYGVRILEIPGGRAGRVEPDVGA